MTVFPMAQAPRKLKRERNPEESRRRILDAAEAEFACKGYNGTRVRDVAELAGVHHGLLRHYFQDKEGLFRAVFERAVEGVSSRAAALLRTTDNPQELLVSLVDTMVQFFAENQQLVLIVHLASLDRGSPAYGACEEIGFRLVQPLFKATVEVIKQGQRAGLLRNDLEARRMLLGALSAVAFPSLAENALQGVFGLNVGAPEEVERHKETAVAILLGGVLKR